MSEIKDLPTPGKNPLNNHTIDLNQCTVKNGTVKADVNLTTCHLVILSPSFGCPGVFESDEKIVLYALADFNFYSVQQDKDDPDCLTERVINYHLKINKWSDGQQQKENSCIEDKLLYTKGTAAKNITCTLMDYLHERKVPAGKGGSTTIPPDRRIYADKEKTDLVACIRKSTRDYYLRINQVPPNPKDDPKPPEEPGELKQRPPLPFLYKIELDTKGMQPKPVPDTLYDISWIILTEKRNAIEFGELQDLACEYIACDKSRELKPEYLYKVTDGKINFAEQDKSSPIQSYHPFIVSNKDKLNFGHLSDVHISARQVAFRESKACVFEGGVLTDTSCVSGEPIGKLFNSSLESFSDMLKTMMTDDEIHAIVITGDLVDHAYNFNPAAKYSKPGELWTLMERSNPDNQKHYQPYIDNLAVLSLFKHCYDIYKKPIFLITGNHDNYKDIFAISPRVGSEKGIVRGNSGLPADHNLTIYEACLMYGPKYHEYFNGNFQAPYADWFHHLFTPLTDYRFTFKQQSVVGLGWGDSEEILNTGIFSLDMTLYRAAESVSDKQLELINAASKEGQEGSQRLICSHFPFVSYDVSLGITTQGSVNCNDWLETVDLYSQGTFKKNRADVYQLLHDKKFHYTLSGHSHRSGVYAGSMHTSYGRKNFIVNGKEIPHDATENLSSTQCNMIVSGCSGPIGVQNNYTDPTKKGLGSFGLDYPSGNSVNFTNNTIKRIIPKAPTAKPRFAVALDYLDIMGRESSLLTVGKLVGSRNGKAGVFESIVSDPTGSTFTFTLNRELPEEKFIESINIVAYVGGKFKAYSMSLKGSSVLVASVEDADALVEKVIAQNKSVKTFLALTFNQALANTVGYKQYNFDSPWTYPIEIVDRQAEMKKMLEAGGGGELSDDEIEQQVKMVSGYELRRHSKFGEIPNFGWYNETFSYNYPGKLT